MTYTYATSVKRSPSPTEMITDSFQNNVEVRGRERTSSVLANDISFGFSARLSSVSARRRRALFYTQGKPREVVGKRPR